ncbi:MAG: carboxypeptidase-like regulatory domain-containing protein [Chitinophagaceae bacterium]
MMHCHTRLLFFFFLFATTLYIPNAAAQELQQTIRGRVTDGDTRQPLTDATVQLQLPQNGIASVTDSNGYFSLPGCPVGRVDLQIALPGYETRVLRNLVLSSGKELVLEITLKEAYKGLKNVVVKGRRNKSSVANEMALVSARSFSVEETKRYAGSLNDPARMVSAFAGVNSDGAGNNDIIVRGNNPRYIQWRLEGIEIPNPNHFAAEGLTGGPINALNSQMLANSDFYTGAFNPQYGNALSGIFDMKLRNGNDERREYSVSLGVLGTDVTLEGPFSKKYKGSYIVNYRYSTLGLLDQAGIVHFNGIPKYQDGSFKLQLPAGKAGDFTLFGLGGRSVMNLKYYDEQDDTRLIETWSQTSTIGVLGLRHCYRLSRAAFLSTTLAFTHNGSQGDGEKPLHGNNFENYNHLQLRNNIVRSNSTLTYKYNSRHQLQAGLTLTNYFYNFRNTYYDQQLQQYQTGQHNKGDAQLMELFALWKWRITQSLSAVNGVHVTQNSLNAQWNVEPRSSLRWQCSETQAISLGLGIHSKMDALTNYFSVIDGSMPNKRMRLSKAFHAVVGYEHQLGRQLFLKTEAYYQYLYNIPVENKAGSSYSLLNQDNLFTDRILINKGVGRNVGIEFTLEKYFHHHYYFLATASLYDSRYRAQDGIWRNTRYNGHYTANLLGGKEFLLKQSAARKNILTLNTKISLLGGRRLLPVNLSESVRTGKSVYDEQAAFDKKNEDVFYINLGVQYRMERKNLTHEWKLEIQNITGNAAIIDYYYNNTTGKTEALKQLGTLPTLSYYLSF